MAKILEWKLGSLCLPACLCMSTGIYIYIVCVCVSSLPLEGIAKISKRALCNWLKNKCL